MFIGERAFKGWNIEHDHKTEWKNEEKKFIISIFQHKNIGQSGRNLFMMNGSHKKLISANNLLRDLGHGGFFYIF